MVSFSTPNPKISESFREFKILGELQKDSESSQNVFGRLRSFREFPRVAGVLESFRMYVFRKFQRDIGELQRVTERLRECWEGFRAYRRVLQCLREFSESFWGIRGLAL